MNKNAENGVVLPANKSIQMLHELGGVEEDMENLGVKQKIEWFLSKVARSDPIQDKKSIPVSHLVNLVIFLDCTYHPVRAAAIINTECNVENLDLIRIDTFVEYWENLSNEPSNYISKNIFTKTSMSDEEFESFTRSEINWADCGSYLDRCFTEVPDENTLFRDHFIPTGLPRSLAVHLVGTVSSKHRKSMDTSKLLRTHIPHISKVVTKPEFHKESTEGWNACYQR